MRSDHSAIWADPGVSANEQRSELHRRSETSDARRDLRLTKGALPLIGNQRPIITLMLNAIALQTNDLQTVQIIPKAQVGLVACSWMAQAAQGGRLVYARRPDEKKSRREACPPLRPAPGGQIKKTGKKTLTSLRARPIFSRRRGTA